MIFFERKSRLLNSLDTALQVLGDREACLCRELTKEYEEFHVFRLAAAQTLDCPLRGEFTVVIGPPEFVAATPVEEVRDLISEQIRTGGRPAETVREVLRRITGWDRKGVYHLYTEIQRTQC